MKFSLFPILFLCFSIGAKAQDSLHISYAKDTATLREQRFMERYEQVFMTKVPTRHMFKIGISQYNQVASAPLIDDDLIRAASLHLGYEFKFLPSFSLALSGHLPYVKSGQPLQTSLKYTLMDAQLRWFFDMRKRVRAGQAASNFSGNYLALYGNMPGKTQNAPNFGIKLGFQQRFFNTGFMDFAIALQQDPWALGHLQGVSVSSQVSFGLAFGDWKKSRVSPLCDVFLCDEHLSSQWKVRLPELAFGYYLNRMRMGIAYEQKIGTSPFSFNFDLSLGIGKGYNRLTLPFVYSPFTNDQYRILLNSKELRTSLSIQPRYYFLHKKQRLTGKGGYGFSGIYAGVNLEHNYYTGQLSLMQPDSQFDIHKHVFKAGPLLGFQQRIFRHGFIDANISYNYQNHSLFVRKNFDLKTSIGLGWAF